MKRLLLFCDGTGMDADNEEDPDLYTNVAKLSRAMEEEDKRGGKTVEQIKFYQSGVGTEEEALGDLVSSALGRGMLQKVKDLYDFVCLNWEEGDEIFLFGFSRGGYTVRLLASLINMIGILSPPQNLHLFPSLFAALDANRGPEGLDHGPREEGAMLEIRKVLKPLNGFRARQQKKVAAQGKGFLIKAVCVFDTVATRGRPSLLRPRSSSRSPSRQVKYNSFGIDQTYLEPCVEIALQALAVDERRVDYQPVLWEREGGGEAEGRGQVLRQVWFSGAHCDIGGGYKEQDLSYIPLTWLVAELQDHLAFNMDYLHRITDKIVADYGKMAPHQSRVGTFRLAAAEDRDLPTKLNPRTNEFYHPSILLQPASHIHNDILRRVSPRRNLRRSPSTPQNSDEEDLSAKRAGELKEDVHTDSDSKSEAALSPPPSPVPSDASSVFDAPYASIPRHATRPSSVTSFTDNESPPLSPMSSSPPAGEMVTRSGFVRAVAHQQHKKDRKGKSRERERERSWSPVGRVRDMVRKSRKERKEERENRDRLF
ncbi:hypothetical protein JCM11251_006607 [Rhodosporidiobolus azoricus]